MDPLFQDNTTPIARSAPPPPSPLANATSPTLGFYAAVPPAHVGPPSNELSTTSPDPASLITLTTSRRSSSASLRGGGGPSSLPSTSRAGSHPYASTTTSPTSTRRPFDLTLPGVPINNRPRTTDKSCVTCRCARTRIEKLVNATDICS